MTDEKLIKTTKRFLYEKQFQTKNGIVNFVNFLKISTVYEIVTPYNKNWLLTITKINDKYFWFIVDIQYMNGVAQRGNYYCLEDLKTDLIRDLKINLLYEIVS